MPDGWPTCKISVCWVDPGGTPVQACAMDEFKQAFPISVQSPSSSGKIAGQGLGCFHTYSVFSGPNQVMCL